MLPAHTLVLLGISMTTPRISPLVKRYLNPDGTCKIGPKEAARQIREIKELPVGPFRTQALKGLNAVAKAYDKSSIVYARVAINASKKIESNPEVLNEAREVRYGENNPCFDIGDRATVKVSNMDLEALSKVIPKGTIDPPMPGVLFKYGPLRTPTPTGFIQDVGFDEYKMSPLVDVPSNQTPGKFNITHPNVGSSVPVPMEAKISSTGNGISKIAMPSSTDPISWRVRKNSNAIQYTIDELPIDSPLLKVDTKALAVREDEMKYWQEALPLPDSLKNQLLEARKRNDSNEIVHLVTSFMGIRDKKTGLSNFRYVCHPRLGKFFRDNADDLPLLMNELKVGHCNLLSWYSCALFRAYGVPAWVARNMLTTKDGKAFNGTYAHSTVVFANEKGELRDYDPTVHCDLDPAYHLSLIHI